MKFLCVCNQGNVRSAALAYTIKYLSISKVLGEYKMHDSDVINLYAGKLVLPDEAIAIGAHAMNKQSFTELCSWADRVICLCEGKESIEYVKNIAKEKFVQFNIGEDCFGSPQHPELIKKCRNFLNEVF
jgi:hypothetical protein